MRKETIRYFRLLIIGAVCFPFQLLAQNPAADTSLTGLYNSIKSISDARTIESIAEMVARKPEVLGSSIKDQCYKYVSVAYATEGNLTKTIYWLSQCKESGTKRLAIADAVKQFLKLGRSDLAEQFLDLKPLIPSVMEQAQIETLKGEILFQQGRYAEALGYLRPGYERGGRNAEQYGIALMKTDRSDQTFQKVNEIILKLHHFGEDFRTNASAFFKKRFGDDLCFTALVDSISAVEQQKMIEKVAKMRIYEKAPDFELTDLNGHTVSLKSLRGKTIFIDFWATWCGPCVASFPGMQKAVDHFKADPSIVFLFVHSYERVANAPFEVKRYLEDKKYRFDVYMDLQSPVAKSFKVSHLPTKLVIDKDGMVKVKSVGYLSEEEAIPEVSAMIELSKR